MSIQLLKSFSSLGGADKLIWRTSFGSAELSFPLVAADISSYFSDPIDCWNVRGPRLPLLGGVEIQGSGLLLGEAWILPRRLWDDVIDHTDGFNTIASIMWIEGGANFGNLEKILLAPETHGASYWSSLPTDGAGAQPGFSPLGRWYSMFLNDPTVFSAGQIDEIIVRLYG